MRFGFEIVTLDFVCRSLDTPKGGVVLTLEIHASAKRPSQGSTGLTAKPLCASLPSFRALPASPGAVSAQIDG